MIAVEVAYGLKNQQLIIPLVVPIGCTVEETILQSGILQHFPDIDLLLNKVGIFGQLVALSQPLKAGDRVEVYRPLKMDPKQARVLRARKVL
ncbi:MAG TPA: RnfH family protein [Gammaproteobacteria bacterium]|nr:RnfH family protein [Gammaproteobacteria bacterium]